MEKKHFMKTSNDGKPRQSIRHHREMRFCYLKKTNFV